MKNEEFRLSPHFTLAELTKTSKGLTNVPDEEQVGNLRRVCRWLEKLRQRWNELYGDGDDGITISSGFRSPAVNTAVKGSPDSNHLTGCAVDIRSVGPEQAFRYACMLLDIFDLAREDFDEILLERAVYKDEKTHKTRISWWVHFAVRPKHNRRKLSIIRID